MEYNTIQPNESTLGKWSRMTDRNEHHKVRSEIAKWAMKNCGTTSIKDVIRSCYKRIDFLYTQADTTNIQDWKELEESNKLTDMMMFAIGQEFGDETKELIDTTLRGEL